MKVSTMLDQIDLGSMALPEFQRGYVWNREQVRGLMQSLYRKYPIGSLLIWVTQTETASARGDGKLVQGSVKLLLDGQQRITTLYGIIRGTPPPFFDGNAQAFTGLHFHLEEETFEFYMPTKMKDNSLWIDVTKLMQEGSGNAAERLFDAPELKAKFSTYMNRLNNFYRSAPVGHALIQQLWDATHANKPNYMLPILNWEPPDPSEEPDRKGDPSGHAHFWRSMSMWFALLKLAEFPPRSDDAPVFIDFKANVKTELLSRLGSSGLRTYDDAGERKFSERQPLRMLPAIYREVWALWQANGNARGWFDTSDGTPYFNGAEQAMLRVLADDGSISGKQYLEPFKAYHDPGGSSTFEEISRHARSGKTVLVDFARADERVRRNLSERICGRLLSDMEKAFGEDEIGDDDFVVLYFEEAHQLFPQADRDLNNVYNRLAKEGAKFHVSMVYATQSMTTLSPDLLKNTENFFIAHLDDDREVKEVTRRYAFRDVADDVQRTMSKGFVRMITQSHRFALPVQIRKFEPRRAEETDDPQANGVGG